MKRIIILSFINLFLAFTVIAQEETAPTNISLANKKGFAILPAAGDIALGADALPYLRYLGNFLNGATATNSFSPNSYNIYARYFLSYNSCLRLNFYSSSGTSITNRFVQDDQAVLLDPLSQDKNTDKRIQHYTDFSVSAGMQKFRGYGRLQGFYGFTLTYGQSRTQYEYEYGNAITEANQAPTSVDWSTSGLTITSLAERPIKSDNGLTRRLHVGPVAGVEYYFAPKICIGAEVSLTYDINWSTEADHVYELWVDGEVKQMTVEDSPGNIYRSIYTYGLGAYGGLYVMFHF